MKSATSWIPTLLLVAIVGMLAGLAVLRRETAAELEALEELEPAGESIDKEPAAEELEEPAAEELEQLEELEEPKTEEVGA